MTDFTYRELASYKYQLIAEYAIQTPIMGWRVQTEDRYVGLVEDGWLTIAQWYAWDGASGPAFDTQSFMRASLVHDALYQLLREDLLPHAFRADADKLLRQVALEDGMSRRRAWWCYTAVRCFGGRAIRKD